MSAYPIRQTRDIAALKLVFDGNWEKFMYSWARREPFLLSLDEEAYANLDVQLDKNGEPFQLSHPHLQYDHIPRWSRKYFLPSAVDAWDSTVVQRVARALGIAVASLQMSDYEVFKMIVQQIPGMGPYNYEHFFRSALLMVYDTHKHPQREFISMGRGARDSKYEVFTDEDIMNFDDFIAAACVIVPMESMDCDSSVLAYAVCGYKRKHDCKWHIK